MNEEINQFWAAYKKKALKGPLLIPVIPRSAAASLRFHFYLFSILFILTQSEAGYATLKSAKWSYLGSIRNSVFLPFLH